MKKILVFSKRNLLLIIFLVFVLVLIISTFHHYGVGWDEIYYLMSGAHYWSKILGFFQIPIDIPFNTEHPSLRYILVQGIVWDILVMAPAIIFHNFSIEFFHLIKALMAMPTFLFVGLIYKELKQQSRPFPTQIIILIPMFLLFLFPRFWGDIFVNAADVPRALLLALNIFIFLKYLKGSQKLFQQILLGVSLALLINQRATFWYVLIVNLFILYLTNRQNKKEKKFILIKKFVVIALTIIITLHFINPYLWQHLLTGVLEILNYNRQFPFAGNVLFEGTVYPVQDLPWYYVPKMMLFTIPVITLSFFLIGQISLIRVIWKKKENYINKLTYVYLLAIFYIPLFLIFIFRPPTYDGWRQMLFLTVPLVIIASFGLNRLLDFNLRVVQSSKIKDQISNQAQSSKLKKKTFGFWIWDLFGNLKFVIWIFICINLLLTAREMVRLHPYEYIYFNWLVGGLKGTYRNYETDYWGLGLKEAILWFNQNINDPKKQYKILLNPSLVLNLKYFKPNMQLVTDKTLADFIITFTRSNEDLFMPGKIIYAVEREKIPLIFIKQL